MKRILIITLASTFSVLIALVIFAYAGTSGKTDIEISLHINDQLVYESEFGESPTFAIWFQEKGEKKSRTVFATRRAAEGDWEGNAEVPVALPRWFEINRIEEDISAGTEKDQEARVDASTGATPVPGYFISRVCVTPGSSWTIWIEFNLAGDFNEFYAADGYSDGQPALLYKAEITAVEGESSIPDLEGMSLLAENGKAEVRPLLGITSATDVLDEILISVVKPKPRIIRKTGLSL